MEMTVMKEEGRNTHRSPEIGGLVLCEGPRGEAAGSEEAGSKGETWARASAVVSLGKEQAG